MLSLPAKQIFALKFYYISIRNELQCISREDAHFRGIVCFFYDLFDDAVCTWDYITWWLVNNELEDLKRIGRGVTEIFFRHFPEGSEESNKKFQSKQQFRGRDSNQARPE
jgi:hypothetical protein